MGRVRAVSLLLVALAAGLVLTSCGSGGNAELLPEQTADQITSYLDQANQSFKEGDCEVAEEAVAAVSTEVDGLQQVDPRLKKALRQGAAKLSDVVSTCRAGAEAVEERAAERAEAEELEQLEAEHQAEEEQEAFETEQKAEEREEKAKEKAEDQAEQPGPSEEGEESNGKAKGHEKQEEAVEPPSGEEELTPEGGGPAGGIGPGAAVEGGGG